MTDTARRRGKARNPFRFRANLETVSALAADLLLGRQQQLGAAVQTLSQHAAYRLAFSLKIRARRPLSGGQARTTFSLLAPNKHDA
jgi:hypothetical protein